MKKLNLKYVLALKLHYHLLGELMRTSILMLVLTLTAFGITSQAKELQKELILVSKDKPVQKQLLSSQPSVPLKKMESMANTQTNMIRNIILAGGGDAAGGNLVEGAPLESYTLKIKESPEMAKALQLIKYIGMVGFDSMDSEIQYVINKKTWYVIPVNLPVLSRETIGTSFAVEQGALQDFEEIWIDQKYYNNMSFDGRVHLLVHEIFMGLKIFSFESYYQQCMVNQPLNVDCLKLVDHKDRKILNLQPLDYQNARKAVNVIWKNYNLLASTNYASKQVRTIANEIFESGGFDSYYKKPSTETYAIKDFSDEDIVNALRNQVTSGKGLPSYCNYKIVEDLGNHSYRKRAQLKSSISFELKENAIFFKVVAKEITTGKVVINNLYNASLKNNKIMDISYENSKSSLTLSHDMGVPGYANTYFAGVKEASMKNLLIGAFTISITSDVNVTSLAFASFNVRNEKISFYDGRDLIKCLEKPEYICEGPQCLDSF